MAMETDNGAFRFVGKMAPLVANGMNIAKAANKGNALLFVVTQTLDLTINVVQLYQQRAITEQLRMQRDELKSHYEANRDVLKEKGRIQLEAYEQQLYEQFVTFHEEVRAEEKKAKEQWAIFTLKAERTEQAVEQWTKKEAVLRISFLKLMNHTEQMLQQLEPTAPHYDELQEAFRLAVQGLSLSNEQLLGGMERE